MRCPKCLDNDDVALRGIRNLSVVEEVILDAYGDVVEYEELDAFETTRPADLTCCNCGHEGPYEEFDI